MAGIVSFGAYIPMYRLARAEINRAWGSGSKNGEKAVANWDEDSLTMGIEAALDCIRGNVGRENIDALFFASTTPPYYEKQSASIAASAVDLSPQIVTADFGNSLRGGSSAFRAALDTVKAGSARRVLVVAADTRRPAPSTETESVWGDGAAALLVGNDNVAVTVEDSFTITNDFMDIWRREVDVYPRSWEDRFVLTYGYDETTKTAVKGLLKKTSLKPSDFAKIAFYGPDARSHSSLARSLGFDPRQVQDPLLNNVGNTGTALAMMVLVSALEDAKPGDRILWASYGDGADAFVLKVEAGIEKLRDRRGIKRHLASKMSLPSYETYLRFRNMLEWAPDIRLQDEPSLTMIWRERNAIIRGHAHKCLACGHIQFPPQRICMWCQAKGKFEEVRIADKKGTIFTFSMDERAGVPVLPNVLTIVELEDACRYYGQLTDRDTSKIDIGMPVELTFRKVNEVGGSRNYFWKIRPVRG